MNEQRPTNEELQKQLDTLASKVTETFVLMKAEFEKKDANMKREIAELKSQISKKQQ
jgi:hypothetical protein